MSQETEQSQFEELADGLSGDHKAEFFQILHEVGISPDDIELARLLKALQLYKSYYESIPAAVQAAAGNINKLKQDIEKLSVEARAGLDAGAQLAGQVIQEAEKVSQGISGINAHVKDAMHKSAEGLTSNLAEILTAGITNSFAPLENRLAQLVVANKSFDDAIARSKKAVSVLQQSTAMVRRLHLWIYGACSFLIVCSLVSSAWFWLHRRYEDRIAAECATLVKQGEKNRAVLLQLSKSNRTLEFHQDPKRPSRKFLVMKDATGWESANKHGVIEFTK
jgi:hypothetical protein